MAGCDSMSECVLLMLYGDGKQFLEPVWYSCGKCKVCKRVPMSDRKAIHER